MKAWLEEYGLIIVGVIVVAGLIALSVWATNNGKVNSANTMSGFNNKADSTLVQNGVIKGTFADDGTVSVTDPRRKGDNEMLKEIDDAAQHGNTGKGTTTPPSGSGG